MASLPMVASGGGNIGYVQSTCALGTSYATISVSGIAKMHYLIIWGKPTTYDFAALFERNSDDTATKVTDLTSNTFAGDVSNITDTTFTAKWTASRTLNYIAIGELS